MPRERTIKDAIREAEEEPGAKRLRESPPDEPGKPEAVNLEREEPVSTAARKRDHL